jgi:hypothetical protein
MPTRTASPNRHARKTEANAQPPRLVRRAVPHADRSPDDSQTRDAADALDAGDHLMTCVARDAVRVRAYYIFLDRGGEPGDPFEDWLRAERELMSGMAGENSRLSGR